MPFKNAMCSTIHHIPTLLAFLFFATKNATRRIHTLFICSFVLCMHYSLAFFFSILFSLLTHSFSGFYRQIIFFSTFIFYKLQNKKQNKKFISMSIRPFFFFVFTLLLQYTQQRRQPKRSFHFVIKISLSVLFT